MAKRFEEAARPPSSVVLLLLTTLACASRTAPTTDPRMSSAPGTAILTVKVLGLKSDEGEVALALFDSAEDFETRTDAVAKGRIPPNDGVAVWRIEDLRHGTYAIAVYHDLNGNRKLDRTSLGPPSEPYGFSNDARRTFGPPKFDRAAIEVGPETTTVEIELR